MTIPTDEMASHFKQVIGPIMNTVLDNHLCVSLHIHSNKQWKKAAMHSTAEVFVTSIAHQVSSSIML